MGAHRTAHVPSKFKISSTSNTSNSEFEDYHTVCYLYDRCRGWILVSHWYFKMTRYCGKNWSQLNTLLIGLVVLHVVGWKFWSR